MVKLTRQAEETQQFAKFNGRWYELQPIYGVGDSNETGSDEGEMCCICLGQKPRVFALPCRHLICCNTCACGYRSRNTVCPLCRQEIDLLVSLGADESVMTDA